MGTSYNQVWPRNHAAALSAAKLSSLVILTNLYVCSATHSVLGQESILPSTDLKRGIVCIVAARLKPFDCVPVRRIKQPP